MVPTRSKTGGRPRPAAGDSGKRARLTASGVILGLLFLGAPALHASAGLQFDVFLGFGGQPTGSGGTVHVGAWSTIGCEVHNPGPPFNALFEFTPGQLGRTQTYRLPLELPTNTRKRFVLPILFGGSHITWNARLLDDRGRVRAELNGMQPRSVAWETLLIGALPRTFAGLPVLPRLPTYNALSAHQPTTVRLLPELLPDNPIALEGLDAIYLNSDRAPELRPAQAAALVQWIVHGGHLILALESPAEVLALPWLNTLMPLAPSQVRSVNAPNAVALWGRPIEADSTSTHPLRASSPNFPKYNPAALHRTDSPLATATTPSETNSLSSEEFPVVVGSLTDGRVLLSASDVPLVVRAKRGRGTITLLTFSPEREPFRSWDRRGWFWARLLQLPPAWFQPDSIPVYGGTSIDGLFGVLLDSRQIHSLPLPWLLLLLAIYLAVIGPLDRILLKRMRREMWTWITFPAYVGLFSLLIYYVGFRLRAGDTEWNELHLVDSLPETTASSWRGRTYASLYSPATVQYPLISTIPHATLRGELLGSAQESGEMTVDYRDHGFLARLSVPVWTSQLIVSDWSMTNASPFSARLVGNAGSYRLLVQNDLDRPLRELRLAFGGSIHELGDVQPHARVEHSLSLSAINSRPLQEFVFQGTSPIFTQIQQRAFAFGGDHRNWPSPGAALLAAASFTTYAGGATPLRDRQFIAPPDFDLSPVVDRGDAVLFAWLPDYAPIPTLRGFSAPRNRQDTMFRLTLPLESAPSP